MVIIGKMDKLPPPLKAKVPLVATAIFALAMEPLPLTVSVPATLTLGLAR